MSELASIDAVRDARDQILREMATGFQGVHDRQDEQNGRTRKLENLTAVHDERTALLAARIAAIESERLHVHRRSTDPQPVVEAPVEPEKRAVTRWDVLLVGGTFGGLFGLLKFLEWIRSIKP